MAPERLQSGKTKNVRLKKGKGESTQKHLICWAAGGTFPTFSDVFLNPSRTELKAIKYYPGNASLLLLLNIFCFRK